MLRRSLPKHLYHQNAGLLGRGRFVYGTDDHCPSAQRDASSHFFALSAVLAAVPQGLPLRGVRKGWRLEQKGFPKFPKRSTRNPENQPLKVGLNP
jgi:hypothetical protein